MKTASTALNIIKGKNRAFFLICVLMRPFIRNFTVFAAAYAYMRWLDNIVDDASNDKHTVDRQLLRQKQLIEELYQGNSFIHLNDQEVMLKAFIEYDISLGCKLKKAFLNMFETLEFDLNRRNKICSREEIDKYSYQMAESFAAFMVHFLDQDVKNTKDLVSLASYSCQAYMLRDLVEDIENGLINIDQESIQSHGINIKDPYHDEVTRWVRHKAVQLQDEMKLLYNILEKRPSFRNRLILLLFIEPRRYVLWKIINKNANPLKEKVITKFDYMAILANVARLMAWKGKEYGSS